MECERLWFLVHGVSCIRPSYSDQYFVFWSEVRRDLSFAFAPVRSPDEHVCESVIASAIEAKPGRDANDHIVRS